MVNEQKTNRVCGKMCYYILIAIVFADQNCSTMIFTVTMQERNPNSKLIMQMKISKGISPTSK